MDYAKVISAIENHFNAVVPQHLIEDHRKEGTEYFRITVTSDETEKEEQVQTEQPQLEPVTSTTNVSHEQPGNVSAVSMKPETEKPQEKSVLTAELDVEMPKTPIPQANFFENLKPTCSFKVVICLLSQPLNKKSLKFKST